MKLFNFFTKRASKDSKDSKDDSSAFSRFFREASSREKKKVFMEVARKASDDQRKVIESVQRARLAN